MPILICSILLVSSVIRSSYYKAYSIHYYTRIAPPKSIKYSRDLSTILYAPYPFYVFNSINSNKLRYTKHTPILIDNTLPAWKSETEFSANKFPVVVEYEHSISRFSNYECIRLRNKENVAEGFYTDKECFDSGMKQKYGSQEQIPFLD